MQRFAIETPPRPIAGVTVTVLVAGTSNLATIYENWNGTDLKPNPFLIPANGEWHFYARGRFDIVLGGTTSAADRRYNEGKAFVCEDVIIFDQDSIVSSENAAANSAAAAGISASMASNSAIAANDSAISANASRAAAETASTTAKKWADENENVTVETGKYSAKHHAIKAAASATTAGNHATTAGNHATTAGNHATTAGNHATTASGHSTNAGNARTAAEAARDKALKWSDENEDVAVETGKYSAKHWAAKAQQLAAGTMRYKGTWAANTGVYPSSPITGDMWKISPAGTILGVVYDIGDSIIYNGTGWDKIDGSESVSSVAGKIGAVTLTASDVSETTTRKWMSDTERTKLTGIAEGANNYVHPASHAPSIIIQDASNRFVTDTEKSTWNAKAGTAVATTSTNGLMSSTDKIKIDGVATGANNYSHPTGDGNLHVPATGTTNNAKVLRAGATAGALSWGDVTFAEVTSKPTTLAGYGITDAAPSSHVGATGTAHGVATTSVNGFMSSTDKTKLDGVATGANNYSHPTGDGNLHVPANGTTNNNKVLKAGATAGTTVWGDVTFAEVASKPTTLSGYGITDAAPSSHTTATGTSAHGATNLNTASTIVARDASGNFSAGTITAALIGNASTATTLQTARTINGVSFNGSANITVAANTTNTLTIGNGLTGTSFNGSAAVTIAVGTPGAVTTASTNSVAAGTHTHAVTLSSSGNRWDKIAHIGSDGIIEAGRYIDFHSTNADETDHTFRIDNSATNVLTMSGSLTATGFNTASKREAKQDISELLVDALDIIKSVEVKQYRYKEDPSSLRVGFIADDTHELLAGPEHDKFDLANAVGLLLKAVQQLAEKVGY